MEQENKQIFDFDLKMIADFFRELDRQGPGGVEQTLRALEFVPDRPGMRIADIGCGTGGQTITIARNRDCTITAVDLLPELLEEFRTRIKKAGLENRVTAIQGSMDALPFSPGEFDVIWAEGSIYNIGFERGLREWRQYLKPGGIIAVTECSWLGRTPGVEIHLGLFPRHRQPVGESADPRRGRICTAGAFRAARALLDGKLLRPCKRTHPGIPQAIRAQ